MTRYGDRHDIWPIDMGTGTMSGVSITNVQRPTFNSQLSTGSPKGRMLGRIWGQTQCVFVRGTRYGADAILDRRVWLRHTDMGTGTVFDILIRNVQRETFNSQLSTG